jgi:hypothetical protein
MVYYVYFLIDPRCASVFYIGKGKGGRLNQHLKQAKAGGKGVKCDRIRDILSEGKEPEAKIVNRFHNEADAYAYEAKLIDAFGYDDLTNVAPGLALKGFSQALRKDRETIEAACQLTKWLQQFGSGLAVVIAGSKIELAPILDGYKAAIAEMLEKRGEQWVRANLSLYGGKLELSHASA